MEVDWVSGTLCLGLTVETAWLISREKTLSWTYLALPFVFFGFGLLRTGLGPEVLELTPVLAAGFAIGIALGSCLHAVNRS